MRLKLNTLDLNMKTHFMVSKDKKTFNLYLFFYNYLFFYICLNQLNINMSI